MKASYAKSLRNLEDISESIHAARRKKLNLTAKDLQQRQPAVGAEHEFKSLSYDLDDLVSIK